MYERYSKLLDNKKVTSHKVSKETGIPYSCLSDWKAGRSKPKTDKLKKLAEYFGVTVDYFVD